MFSNRISCVGARLTRRAATAACLLGALPGLALAQTQVEIDRLWRDYEKKREAIDKDLAKRREAALGPATKEFVSRMQRLAEDATRSGKLTEALAAREAIAKVMVPGKWKFDGGPTGANDDAELQDNGRVSGTATPASWSIEGAQLVVKWSDGTLYKYDLPATWDTVRLLKGTASNGMSLWDVRMTRR